MENRGGVGRKEEEKDKRRKCRGEATTDAEQGKRKRETGAITRAITRRTK